MGRLTYQGLVNDLKTSWRVIRPPVKTLEQLDNWAYSPENIEPNGFERAGDKIINAVVHFFKQIPIKLKEHYSKLRNYSSQFRY